jgi:FkbM family methyltransferase
MISKLFLRNAWSSFLALIPLRYLDPIRKWYTSSPSGSLRRTIFRLILKLLRYRPLDSSIRDFELADRTDIRFINVNTVISRRLFWLGQNGYEGSESKWWEYFCSQSYCILEIGANIGFYTILGANAALRGSRYISVEPHPLSVNALRQNVALNNLNNVEIIEGAVVGKRSSDTVDLMLPLGDSDIAPGGAYLSIGVEGWERPARNFISVKTVEASEVIADTDLIKLDVEGNEWNILSALRSHIELNRPTIFVEILSKTPKLRRLLFEWHKDLGYKIYIPKSDDLLLQISGEKLIDCDFYQEYGIQDVILSATYDKSL